MRVEQALRLLPNLEALVPLRVALLATAQRSDVGLWDASRAYLTVGKRGIEPEALGRRMHAATTRVADHLSHVYGAYVSALERIEANDTPGAIGDLLAAASREESVGRTQQAVEWLLPALDLAVALPVRRPEIETLLFLGRLRLYLGNYDESARHCQRALVLAEGEMDRVSAMLASEGLGHVAVEQENWNGATAWYNRALRLAETARESQPIGRLYHALGELSRRRGDLATANDHLRRARELFEAANDAREMARVLVTQGMVDAKLGLASRAAGAYREALAWMRSCPNDPGLEVFIRLNYARLHLDAERFLEAEDELRRAEEHAIVANLTRRLVQIYSLLGTARGRQGDEAGFIFFEQAIELSRTIMHYPLAEAQVCHEYGLFRLALHQRDEAAAYLERAREIFESVGALAESERVKADLQQVSA